MKYSLDAIPVEVLVLAFIEVVCVGTLAACFGTRLGTTDLLVCIESALSSRRLVGPFHKLLGWYS